VHIYVFKYALTALCAAGIVHPKNVTNILFKNMVDASLAALVFWGVGYGALSLSFESQ